jgi:uncharacterized membrane protein
MAIGALSALGMGDALYMLAYEEGLIDSLVCPFFGEGCNIVGRSRQARHFGVPNAAVGALAYGVLGILALAPRGEDLEIAGHDVRTLAIQSIGAAAVAASAFLLWEQVTKVRALCFWCLGSAAINAAVLKLSFQPRGAGARPHAGRPAEPAG